MLGEIERDLRARVAGADHQHALVHEPIRVAVLARVNERAPETLLSRQAFGIREAVEPGRDHDCLRPVSGTRALDDESVARGTHATHRLSCARHDGEAGRVGFEIGDHLGARRVARQLVRERDAGQMRLLFNRVQAQPVVMMPPRTPKRRASFEDQRLDATLLEAGGARQARRSRADDQDRKQL